jgi:iron complex transport system permease protein
VTASTLEAGTRPARILARFALLPLVLAGSVVLGLAYGTDAIPIREVLQVLGPGSHLCTARPPSGAQPDQNLVIICDLRLPGVIAAALVGAGLALAGALFQAVLRNPLADPYVIGTSAGAQLGVTLVFILPIQVALWGFGTQQVAAFLGALGTVLLVYLLARTPTGTPVVTLILSGFVISSFLISATTLLTYIGAGVSDRLSHLLTWTLGGLDVQSWQELAVSAPCIIIAGLLALLLAPRLDLMLLGEEQAAHLGVRVEQLKLAAIVLASLLTALAVTIGGIIPFVGLVVPHAMRLLYGPRHRNLLPVSAAAGAAFVVLCDLIARVAIAPAELPLGVVTAVVGAPFFLHLLRRSRRAYAL